MFAVIRTGGKQYRVAAGDEITVEKLTADAGETIQFNEVLMLGGGKGEPKLGTPLVNGAGVRAEVIGPVRGPKVVNFKRRRRKHSSKRLKGHRQELTAVRITDIVSRGAAKSGVKPALGPGEARRAGVSAEATPAESADSGADAS